MQLLCVSTPSVLAVHCMFCLAAPVVCVQGIRGGSTTHAYYYDHGAQCTCPITGSPKKCNQRLYGQSTAPAYNLSAIRTPIALFTGMQWQ